jgi:simple sugar transport system ATP-binding protein
VRKRFGATVALDEAQCLVREGTVHALLGENGAGKTTLMRIAFGMVTADAGEVSLHGKRLDLRSSADAIAAGIGMVHQHFMLIPAMTVAENVVLGGHGRLDPAAASVRTREVASAAGLALDPEARVRDLSIGAQQRLEIVKALARDARILILDEPTAVLSPAESEELYAWLRRFAASGGTVVLITHRLHEALAVADDVTVLRRGATVLERSAGDLAVADVITALTGETAGDGSSLLPESAPAPLDGPAIAGPVRLALEHVRHVDGAGILRLDDVSLEVREGEILGVIAIEGSGERELLRILAGRLEPVMGTVRRPSVVGFIPADRVHEALIPSMSLTENFALAGAGARRGLIDWQSMRERAQAAIDGFRVQATGPAQPALQLSGGNQQRFVVARERAVAPQALVAENPGRGLDIRAARHVRDEMLAARNAGAAIVFYSSDIDEVLAVATRVVACHRGRVREVTPPPDPDDRSPYTRALMGVG